MEDDYVSNEIVNSSFPLSASRSISHPSLVLTRMDTDQTHGHAKNLRNFYLVFFSRFHIS